MFLLSRSFLLSIVPPGLCSASKTLLRRVGRGPGAVGAVGRDLVGGLDWLDWPEGRDAAGCFQDRKSFASGFCQRAALETQG